MQETQGRWVGSPDWEASLEKKMAAHSSILAWRIPWTEEPSELKSVESQSQTQLRSHMCACARTHTHPNRYIHTQMHSSIHHLSSPLSIQPCIHTFSFPCIRACILLRIHSSTYANIHDIYTSTHINPSIHSPFTL